MHIRVIAVGGRQPGWVDDAFDSYAARLPREWKFRLAAIAAAKRGKNERSGRAAEVEGQRILAAIRTDEFVVLLDEAGRQYSSSELAASLGRWQSGGRDLCFVIGGPDGVPAICRERADLVWSLSALTLPHGLARVLLAEQLYRAWSLQVGHPYHRE